MVTIHIIDRDPAVRVTARRALEAAGFMVTEAADEADAERRHPDLIVADPAAASVASIRRRHPAAYVLATGAGGLSRPFTPSQLLAAVRLSLARGAMPRAAAATTGSRRRSPRPSSRRS